MFMVGGLAYGQLSTIGIGTAANDGTGDPLRTAFGKVNTAIGQINTNTTAIGLRAPLASPTFSGTMSFSNGTTMVNGDADNFTIIEGSVNVVGDFDVSGDVTFGNSATASSIFTQRLRDTTYITDSYTLILTDADNWVDAIDANTTLLTIPPNADVALPVGTEIFFMQGGAGVMKFVAGAGVVLAFEKDSVTLNTRYRSAFIRQWMLNKWVAGGLLD